MFDDNVVFCLLMKRREEPSAEEKESVLLVLTNDGYLKVINADTGFVLRSIFLSKIIKYRCVAIYDVIACVHILEYSSNGKS